MSEFSLALRQKVSRVHVHAGFAAVRQAALYNAVDLFGTCSSLLFSRNGALLGTACQKAIPGMVVSPPVCSQRFVFRTVTRIAASNTARISS